MAATALLAAATLFGADAHAQERANEKSDTVVDRISIFESTEEVAVHPSEMSVKRSRMSVAELRQARALYRANQRVARFEYNLWIGHEPLRPNWNAVPMMSSRYGNHRFYVPVYVYSR